ncbi:long-chain-fatty-acid-CoA-ligase [Lentinula aciculospora]|uniref:Long-chain-fatty-acid-CoA-ligase n=1 Tax=Lentinula aciculospora TaxID=153920 RepID=A0A9W9A2F0_9AGAR|nr:long-chain-fatty-acid-CoA-ligase [Lentinula aciculospora]
MPALHTNKPGYFGKGSVEIGPPAEPGEGPIRRIAITPDRLVTQPFDGIETVYDVLEYAARTHGTRRALGWRDIVDIHEEEKEIKGFVNGKEVVEKKKWKYFQLSDYKYINFIELKEAVSEIARGLVEIGVTSDAVCNIFSQTRYAVDVLSYDTLGESGLTHSLNEPGCVGLFTNAELLPTLYKVLANTPSITFVVYDGEPSDHLVSDINAVRESIKVLSIDDLRELGNGSTGPPKGVCITHANLVASIGAVYTLLGHHLTYDDTYLAYLPLAHVLEYIVELIMLFVGMTSGYGRVKTLTDASVRQCKGDLAAFQPSIMVGVPAVWETIRKGIVAKVNAGGSVRKSVFNGAMSLKKNSIPVLSQVADSVVLKSVRTATGGRLRITLSGGATLSHETQKFLDTALVMILQGYGMTESCGMCAILPPEMMRYSSVGLPVPSIEIKLLDVKEAGYLSTGKPPQGEVCIRGPSVTKGYYKRPDLNNDETIFSKDGWLRTGDVGQWNEDGTLSLIDRVKNLVKLQGGEYIALERLESTYKACNYVGNICVHATPDAKQPIAITIPHEVHLRHGLQNVSGIDSSRSLSELRHDSKVAELVLKECNAVGKKNEFKSMEILQAVILTPEEWTPENGLVTAAQKIQRNKIAKEFSKEIEG